MLLRALSKKCQFLIILLIMVLSGISLYADYWEYLGLGAKRVNVIEVYDSYLYVGTETGVYRKSLLDSDTVWTSLGIYDKNIRGLLILSADTILVSVVIYKSEKDEVSIYRTIDGGMNWHEFQNGFGGTSPYGQKQVIVFTKQPQQSDTIFATGIACIGRSLNAGQSWDLVWGDWDGMAMGVVFIKPDPYLRNRIWAGGEGGFFNPWLMRSDNYGESFEFLWIEVGGDNRCHDIAIDPYDSDHAYVSMEGKVIESFNAFNDYDIIYENNFYLYSIEINPYYPEKLYVCGAQYSYPLTIFYSYDGGVNWSQISEPDLTENGALDMLIIPTDLQSDLYFATLNGVYKYSDTYEYICGDANTDSSANVSDAVYIINYVFIGGDPPSPIEAGDANCDGSVSVSDAVWIINHVFIGGNEPCDQNGDGIPDC